MQSLEVESGEKSGPLFAARGANNVPPTVVVGVIGGLGLCAIGLIIAISVVATVGMEGRTETTILNEFAVVIPPLIKAAKFPRAGTLFFSSPGSSAVGRWNVPNVTYIQHLQDIASFLGVTTATAGTFSRL